jgi:hypothetical protein
VLPSIVLFPPSFIDESLIEDSFVLPSIVLFPPSSIDDPVIDDSFVLPSIVLFPPSSIDDSFIDDSSIEDSSIPSSAGVPVVPSEPASVQPASDVTVSAPAETTNRRRVV